MWIAESNLHFSQMHPDRPPGVAVEIRAAADKASCKSSKTRPAGAWTFVSQARGGKRSFRGGVPRRPFEFPVDPAPLFDYIHRHPAGNRDRRGADAFPGFEDKAGAGYAFYCGISHRDRIR
ncbi:hypothetical protein Sfum_3562 [Syntrophobacter fumaroxidans MPOB]|uniref:Uncharacterized protein n=1 Tax=Syntrophobacter fumaroxidans (strain DSM 10017 / MPOB) TaxID=335543 RepID=A0LP80_SYNFM|nr:hypothetical protein Sfum_3562 [Syntrophobacter fumaroxidans MPOB]